MQAYRSCHIRDTYLKCAYTKRITSAYEYELRIEEYELSMLAYVRRTFRILVRRTTDMRVDTSLVTRKQDICLCENKGADQLCEDDQRLCFRYTDDTISLLLTSEISSL